MVVFTNVIVAVFNNLAVGVVVGEKEVVLGGAHDAQQSGTIEHIKPGMFAHDIPRVAEHTIFCKRQKALYKMWLISTRNQLHIRKYEQRTNQSI